MNKSYLIENIRYLMATKKYSQRKLADEMEWAASSVNNYLNGKAEPSVERLIQLATLFDVSLDDLVSVDMIKEGINPKKQSTKMSGTSDLDNLLRGLYKEISILTTRMGAVDNNVDMLLSKVKEYKKKFPNAAVWKELADELKKINYKL